MKKCILLLLALLCINTQGMVFEIVATPVSDKYFSIVGSNINSGTPIIGSAAIDGSRIVAGIWEYDKVYAFSFDGYSLVGIVRGSVSGLASVTECDHL